MDEHAEHEQEEDDAAEVGGALEPREEFEEAAQPEQLGHLEDLDDLNRARAVASSESGRSEGLGDQRHHLRRPEARRATTGERRGWWRGSMWGAHARARG